MTQSNAYLNRIATAVPDHEIHQFYLRFGASMLSDHPQRLSVFERMTDSAGSSIAIPALRRPTTRAARSTATGTSAAVLSPARPSAWRCTRARRRCWRRRPSTAAGRRGPRADHASDRHQLHRLFRARHRPRADRALRAADVGRAHHRRLHGLLCGDQRAEAGAPHRALRARRRACWWSISSSARCISRRRTDLEKLLSFCCGATAAPPRWSPPSRTGIALDSFHAVVAPEQPRADDLEHPRRRLRHGAVGPGARRPSSETLRNEHRGHPRRHAGPTRSTCGRCIRAAARCSTRWSGRSGSAPRRLPLSREVLRQYGNMSSATVMFVLDEMLEAPPGLHRLRHGVRPGADRRDDDVPDGLMSVDAERMSQRAGRAGDCSTGCRPTIRGRSRSRRDLVRINALMFQRADHGRAAAQAHRSAAAAHPRDRRRRRRIHAGRGAAAGATLAGGRADAARPHDLVSDRRRAPASRARLARRDGDGRRVRMAGERRRQRFDLVTANLFLHHFDDAELAPAACAAAARWRRCSLATEPRRGSFRAGWRRGCCGRSAPTA